MACKATVLIAGVDTLVLNLLRCDREVKPIRDQALPDSLTECLMLYQEQAQRKHDAFVTPWEHEELALQMQPFGTPVWMWLLKNGYIDVMLGSRLKTGLLGQVRFSSEYLWSAGADVALTQTHAFLMEWLDEYLFLQPSQVHLCADVANLVIPPNYGRLFVSQAKKKTPIKPAEVEQSVYKGHRLETLQFSGHKNPISTTIYDKRVEIESKSKKRWFYPLWKEQGWNEEMPVLRVECRLKREALHEMDIEEAYSMMQLIPSIWAFCVGQVGEKSGWLRMVSPNTRDSNRWRWNTAPTWKEVQKAFLEHWHRDGDIKAIQRERKREVNLDQAEAAMAGYLTTYSAWLKDEIKPDDDVSVVLQRLYERIVMRWEKKGVDFHELRIKKQYDYHIL